LARSSRNGYLTTGERAVAPVLHRALCAGEEAIARGIHDVNAVQSLMRTMIAETPGVALDYLAVVDPETFLPPEDFRREILIAGAMKVGRTRLIDNVRIARA
jgi:pantoate--beta-alanine ligase